MNLLKRFWPVVLIFAVWFIFSSPYFVKHKVPFPSTYLVNFFSPWNAYPGFASPVKNNAMPDVISQIYPWKSFTIDYLKKLEIPLWNPYSFSGTPNLANYQSAVLSPFNLLFFILPFIDAWSMLILLQPLLAGIFMYLYLRTQSIEKEGSTVGSLAFMFCGFITTWMAYGTLAYAILFLPLALFSIEKYYKTKKSRFLILLSLSFPLSFLSGHFQTSVYFLIFVVAYLIFKFFQTKIVSNTLHLILYSFLGLLLSLPQLLPSFELYSQSLRSGIFEKIEVIPWGYLPTLLAPDFLGNPVTRNDWFGHYAEWNAYIGLLPLMLSFYALFVKRKKETLFFGLMGLIAILFSYQTPFLDLLVALKIPVLSTSAASRIIVLFSFSMSVLAAFGFQSLLEGIKEKKNKPIFLWLLSFLFIFVLLWVAVLLKLFIPQEWVVVARQNLIFPTVIFVISFFLISVSLFLKNKKSPHILYFIFYILIFIVAFDVLRFANKWMPFDPKNLMYPSIPVVNEFLKISGYERVLSNLGGEATVYYKLPSVEGYDAVYIKRYGTFIASLKEGGIHESARSVVSFPKYGLYIPSAVNLLGMDYLVHKVSDGRAPWAFPFWTYKDNAFSLLYDDGSYQVYKNNNVLQRAFLVNKYTVENDPEKILNTMFGKDFDLKSKIVLEQNPSRLVDSQSTGSAKIISYAPDKISVKTDSTGNSLLFLSDTYYPGWEALVDGQKTPIYRADFTFRAIVIPKGNHNVEFIYSPVSFKFGLFGAVLSIATIALFEVGRKKRVNFFPKT